MSVLFAVLGVLLMIAFFFGCMIGGILLRALVISNIWGWYMVPLFGIAPIGLAMAFGLSCFAQLFTTNFVGMKADAAAQIILTKKRRKKLSFTCSQNSLKNRSKLLKLFDI